MFFFDKNSPSEYLSNLIINNTNYPNKASQEILFVKRKCEETVLMCYSPYIGCMYSYRTDVQLCTYITIAAKEAVITSGWKQTQAAGSACDSCVQT